ncbi:hypothetical protein OUZ56_011906 [Daphnia magna]|uniref:Uncharacterized protein n=1 Tax=Daphnia magna TaxID=35525 RepID=A0ABQ9Z1H8_9CRUS|nr:hypothetical protein OUZ56_011906 [Daphnia magna]
MESESALTSRGNKSSPTKPLPLCINSAPGAAAASYHSDVKVSPNIILDSANSNHASPSSNDQTITDDHRRTFSLEHSPIRTAINASRANQDTICRDLTPSSSRITNQPRITKLQEKRSSRPLEKDSIKCQVELIIISPLLTEILPRPQAVLRYNLLKKLNFLLQSPKYHPRHLTPRSRQLIQDLIGPLFVHAEIIIKDLISTLSFLAEAMILKTTNYELYTEGYSSGSPTDEPSSESSSGEELPVHFDIDVDINTPGPTSDCESSVGTRRKRYRQQSSRATGKKLPNAIHQHPANSANIISHTKNGINCTRHRPTAPSSGTSASNQNKHQPVKTSQKMNNNQQPHQRNNLSLGDLQDYQKGQRALTMLLQIPNFSGGLTARFDRWIKLFDNVVAMSNWTEIK